MTGRREGKPIDILLVEDNPGDVRPTREAVKEGGINTDLFVVRNGEEALDFLYQRGNYTDATRPDVVLLDLNLPRIDGGAVLKTIKDDDNLTRIPVVILTNSEAEQDILQSYELHASASIPKPVDSDDVIDLVHTFEEFWCPLVRLPTDPEK